MGWGDGATRAGGEARRERNGAARGRPTRRFRQPAGAAPGRLRRAAGSEGEGRLGGGGKGDAFEGEHPRLTDAAAGGGEAAELAVGCEDAVAGDEERDGVPRHGLADVAGGLRAGAELAGEGAVGGGLAPGEGADGGVDAGDEGVLRAEVEADGGEVDGLAGK